MKTILVLQLVVAAAMGISRAKAEAPALRDANQDLEMTADALVPRNGAEIAVFTGDAKSMSPLELLQKQTYSKEKIPLSKLISGAIVCLRTSDGQYIKMEVLGVSAQKGVKGASNAHLKLKRTLYSSDGTEVVDFSGSKPGKDPKAVVQFGTPATKSLDFSKPTAPPKPEPEPQVEQSVRGAQLGRQAPPKPGSKTPSSSTSEFSTGSSSPQGVTAK